MTNHIFIRDGAILMLSLLKERYRNDRKLITKHIKTHPSIYSKILFCMLNGRGYDEEIRKIL